MTQAFNPFAAPAPQPAPSPRPAAAQPQRPVATDMNDASQYDGISTPFFKHIEGEFDVKITGYVGARTTKLGRACHISFEVMTSTNEAIPVGTSWRIAYRYDFERSEKADADVYGADMRTLGQFVQSLFKQTVSAGFDAKAAERSLHSHDWATQPAYVHLSASLGKAKPGADGTTTMRYRNDRWLPTK